MQDELQPLQLAKHYARAHERQKHISTPENKNKYSSIILQLLQPAPHPTTLSVFGLTATATFRAAVGTEAQGEKAVEREGYKSCFKVMEKMIDPLEEKIIFDSKSNIRLAMARGKKGAYENGG